jgi:hypothetical protein
MHHTISYYSVLQYTDPVYPVLYSYINCLNKNKKFWEQLIAHFPFTTYWEFDTIRTAEKILLQQFFYCCVCIRCHGKVFTEPLLSNDSGGNTQTHRQQGDLISLLLFLAYFP